MHVLEKIEEMYILFSKSHLQSYNTKRFFNIFQQCFNAFTKKIIPSNSQWYL